MLKIKHRLRRNRSNLWSRDIVRENYVSANDLIMPIFVTNGQNVKDEIHHMQDNYVYSIDMLPSTIRMIEDLGIRAVALFPNVDTGLKNSSGSESYNPENIMCRAIREIKKCSDIGVISDVALDPYTNHGHDGIVDQNGYVMNDETVDSLCKMALIQAAAGSDAIAPSAMMDGRVKYLREALDNSALENTVIISYSAKYCSKFYGPFRYAVGSHQNKGYVDKSSYQIDPCNSQEAIQEIRKDVDDGADMIIVKPGMPYLDIVSIASKKFDVPIISYQVSGEYSMLNLYAKSLGLNYEDCLMESLIAFKRAGARAIISYGSMHIAKKLRN